MGLNSNTTVNHHTSGGEGYFDVCWQLVTSLITRVSANTVSKDANVDTCNAFNLATPTSP